MCAELLDGAFTLRALAVPESVPIATLPLESIRSLSVDADPTGSEVLNVRVGPPTTLQLFE